MPANESLVGRAAAGAGLNINSTGFKVLRTELQLASKVLGEGLLAGVGELATGGSKVKAIWESIKWSTLARAGAGGFVFMATAATGLAAGIRSVVKETGALQAAVNRLTISDKLQKNFEALLGSVSAAKTRVSELYAFAASSKFEFTDIAAASRTLTALSNGIKGGLGDLQQLGKISAATSVPLQDLAGAVGQAGNAMRTGLDFSGPLSQLQEMGVMTEGTTKRLQAMAIQGASTTAIMDAFSASLEKTSETLGETDKSIEDLEKGAAKAQEEMMAAFGAPFVERHRKEVELTGKVYQNWTGIMGNLGKLLSDISAPFDNISMTTKEIAASKGFTNLAGGASMFAATLIPVTAAYLTIKGLVGLLGSGLDEFNKGGLKGIGNVIKGAISPTARGADWAARAGRIMAPERAASSLIGPLQPTAAAKGAELMAHGWTKVGQAVKFAGEQFTRLAPRLMGLMAPMLALSAVTIIAGKAWDIYSKEIEKAKRLSDMSDSIKKDTAAMEEQAKGLKTMDDYLDSLTKAQIRYNAALAEQAKIEGDINMTEDDRHGAEAKVAVAAKDLRKVERQDTSQLGQGKEEVEAGQKRAAIEKQIKEIIFQAQVARASDGEKAILLAKEQARYEEIAAEHAKTREVAPEILKAKTQYEGAGKTDAERLKGQQATVARIKEELAVANENLYSAGHGGPFVDVKANREKVAELEKELEMAEKIELQAMKNGQTEEKRGNLIAEMKKGGKGSQLEAEAMEEEAKPVPDRGKIDKLRGEAAKFNEVDEKEAREKAAELRSQSLANVRKQQSTSIAQAYAKQALGVTSETYQAEDVLARQQQAQNTEQFAEATKYYNPEEATEEAKTAYDQQKTAVELENAQIQKGINERAQQLARDKAAFDASMKARDLESQAAQHAAKGNFIAAAASQKAAQDVVDKQADLARAVELRAQGYSEAEAKAMQATEKEARSKERKQTAENKLGPGGSVEKELKEKQLELASRGITSPGYSGPTGEAAKKELSKLQDTKKLEENFNKIMEGVDATPENIEKGFKAAKEMTATDIAAETELGAKGKEGEGAVASSLTRIGGGGGYYAGSSAKGTEGNAVEIANRQSAIMGASKNSLERIEQAMLKDGIKVKGAIQ
jgi:hypothetical protein